MSAGELLDEAALDRLHEDYAATGDLEELAVLIGNFLRRAEESVESVRSAFGRGDAEGVRTAAHRLKGSSSTLGASALGATAGRVEAAAAAGELMASGGRVGELEDVFGRTRDGLTRRAEAISAEAAQG